VHHSGFTRGEGVTVDVERPSLGFAGRAAEGVDPRPDDHIDEADVFEHLLPACARQAAGDSTGPQIDLA
jgi:hypothetical protein